MQLTSEQQAIIDAPGNIKINAVAGSGKTTTLIAYAQTRPRDSSILYIAFNRTVKLEAQRKFAAQGLSNVTIETAHSLAYKHIVYKHGYRVKANGYKTHEIAELLGLQASGEKHAEYIVANHINKFITYFCNSDKARVQHLNYLDVVTDPKARIFVSSFYDYIQTQARVLLAKMDKGEIEITHDFYLKKFQRSNPVLPYHYILFDEGQDASAAMLDVFLKQQCIKVIVGDTHQQIYGWRYAINSIEQVDFDVLHLSTSFRFRQTIADLAVQVLGWKKELHEHKPVTITGAGNSTDKKTKAVLARTNLGLLLKAIAYVNEKKSLKHIYFEGNINSYTYADEGASLYDVLYLYNNKRSQVKDKLIASMNNLSELEEYIEKTEDVQLGMMVEIVKEYGNDIFDILKTIKEKHVGNEDREKAEIIFSTVHRSKGMEYDAVQLVNDFINEEKLDKAANDKEKPMDKAKLLEEINLLYVAITRTKNMLYIPEQLLPKDYPPVAGIKVIREVSEEDKHAAFMAQYYGEPNKKTGKKAIKAKKKKMGETAKPIDKEAARQVNKSAFTPWTESDDEELTKMYCEGKTMAAIASRFKRTTGAIQARIKKLELWELYG